MKELAASEWDVLPRQKVASNNANLGNWQLSSSVSKSLSFYAWCCNRAPQLGEEAAWLVTMQLDVEALSAAVRASSFRGVTIDHRGSDCQLVFWGKLHEGQSQPSLKALGIELSECVFKLDKFDSIPALYEANSFDWGGASSPEQLSES